MKIIFATHNQHKAQEVSAILKGSGIKITTLTEIGMHEDIIEDGTTMKENAWIKADFIYKRYGGNVLSDDSGLEVDALGGAPGLFSARYAGPQKNDDDNINKLLAEMTKIEDRTAQFRAVLALQLNDQQYTFEGIIRGTTAAHRIGTDGFGYDPIFIPEGYDTSFGVLDEEIKNSISHRARALSHLSTFLEQLANTQVASTCDTGVFPFIQKNKMAKSTISIPGKAIIVVNVS